MSKTYTDINGFSISLSSHIVDRQDGKEVYKQMFVNDISGGTLDNSGNLTNIIVTGEAYNVKLGNQIIVKFNGKEYTATRSRRKFTATIPANDLKDVSDGASNIVVESVAQVVLPLNISGSYTLSIDSSMTFGTMSILDLTTGYEVGSYSEVAGRTYGLVGDTSSYYLLDSGSITLTAAGQAAFNDTSLAISLVIVDLKCSDGTGRYVVESMASYIRDPVTLVEPVPSLPAHLIGNYELTFQDEFSSGKIRDEHWAMKGANTTAGMGYNSIDSLEMTDSDVVLMTQKDPKANNCGYEHYAGCEITTLDKFAQLYGYFECRGKGTDKRGAWPAFWLMPDRGDRGRVAQDKKILMSFDLSSVTEVITSAVLTYSVLSSNIDTGDMGDKEIELQVYTFKDWHPDTVSYEDIKTIPFHTLSNQMVSAGSVVDTNVVSEISTLIDKKYHCMIADNYLKTINAVLHSKDALDINLRPKLVINGDITIYPYQDGELRAGLSGATPSREFTTGLETYTIFDAYANAYTTSDGGMEIDIWENLAIWGADVNAHALHWDGYGSLHKGAGPAEHYHIPPTSDGYHVYGCLWEAGKLTFWVDGVQTWVYEDERVCSVPMYILLSMQTGGWNDNNKNLDIDNFPAKAYFDYVRVWKQV